MRERGKGFVVVVGGLTTGVFDGPEWDGGRRGLFEEGWTRGYAAAHVCSFFLFPFSRNWIIVRISGGVSIVSCC